MTENGIDNGRARPLSMRVTMNLSTTGAISIGSIISCAPGRGEMA